jgi:hypothetical protein
MKQTYLYLWYPLFQAKKKTTSDSTTKFSETDIINMLQSLIDNIVVIFGGRVFQPTDGIPIGINCAAINEFAKPRVI